MLPGKKSRSSSEIRLSQGFLPLCLLDVSHLCFASGRAEQGTRINWEQASYTIDSLKMMSSVMVGLPMYAPKYILCWWISSISMLWWSGRWTTSFWRRPSPSSTWAWSWPRTMWSTTCKDSKRSWRSLTRTWTARFTPQFSQITSFCIDQQYPGWCSVANRDFVSLWTEEIPRDCQDAGSGEMHESSCDWEQNHIAQVRTICCVGGEPLHQWAWGRQQEKGNGKVFRDIMFLLAFVSHLLSQKLFINHFLSFLDIFHHSVVCPGWRCPLLAMSVTQPSV